MTRRNTRRYGHWSRVAVRVARRLALSLVASMLITAGACMALFVTTSARWVSLTVEPLSLLLMPGVVASMLVTKSHDYKSGASLAGAFLFYFLFVYVLLWGRDVAARRRVLLERS